MPGELFPDRIETERLVLEPLTTDHVDVFEFYEICSSDPGIEEVTEYVTWDPHGTVGETRAFLESVEEDFADAEGCSYVIRLGSDEDGAGEIAGAAAMGVDWDRRAAGLGTWLRKRFWGRGYSGERAAAMMELAFDRLDLEIVEVFHETGNDKSRRAIEKYVDDHGGRHEGELRNHDAWDGEPVTQHRYTVARAEYEASGGGPGVIGD